MVCGTVILHVEWSEYELNIHLLHLSVTALPLSYQTFSAPSRARTYYLSVNSRTLCQMSYGSTLLPRFELGLRGSKPRVIYHYTIRAIGTCVVPTYYVIGLILQHLVEPASGTEGNRTLLDLKISQSLSMIAVPITIYAYVRSRTSSLAHSVLNRAPYRSGYTGSVPHIIFRKYF